MYGGAIPFGAYGSLLTSKSAKQSQGIQGSASDSRCRWDLGHYSGRALPYSNMCSIRHGGEGSNNACRGLIDRGMDARSVVDVTAESALVRPAVF